MFLKPGLYIVSTPIGNLGDITLRALEVLKNSDVIFCEDTRISKKLLAKHQIASKLQVYNDHSTDKQRTKIIQLIEEGRTVSLISDAGTPLISDPGYKLVKELRDLGLHVDIIPGACAPITALIGSGLPTDRFFFSGFLPKTIGLKKKTFQELVSLRATLIFFDTAPRILESLQIAMEILGDKRACMARELTKLYQEFNTALLSELIETIQRKPIKGEVVILISNSMKNPDKETTDASLKEKLAALFNQGLSSKSATEEVYKEFANFYSKHEIYKAANELKKQQTSDPE